MEGRVWLQQPQQAMGSQTLYAVLGVGLQAPEAEIRAAYRRLARQWHPDRHRGDDAAKRRFQAVQHAYEVLVDGAARRAYDLRLVHLLDVEDYLSRFQELILTASGLDMLPPPAAGSRFRRHRTTHQNSTSCRPNLLPSSKPSSASSLRGNFS